MSTEKKKPRETYEEALLVGQEELTRRTSAEVARASGCTLRDDGFVVPVLGTDFLISHSGDTAVRLAGGERTKAVEHILLVHYLGTSDGTQPTGREVSFREVPGGRFYEAVFHARAVLPLIKTFANDGEAYKSAAESLGGRTLDRSGYAARFTAFPWVPVVCTYWPGEDEMPPGASIVFDESVAHHLPVEDIAVLGEYLTARIVEGSGKGQGGSVSLYEYE